MTNAARTLHTWGRLILRELHDQTWTVRFIVLTTTAGLLTPLLVFVGIRDFSIRQQRFELVRQDHETRQSTLVNGQRLEVALRVQRAPQAAATLVRGADDLLPTAWDFGPDGTHPDAASGGATRLPQAGVSLDLEFLIRVVLGLLAVSLAADSVAGERQSGTLYVLFSQPLHRWPILASKLVGGVLALGLTLLLVITGAIAAIALFGPELWRLLPSGTVWSLYVVGMMYLVALYALGLVVGTLSSSVASANAWAISLWIVIVLSSVPALDLAVKTFLPVTPVDARVVARVRLFDSRLNQTELDLGNLLVRLVGPRDTWRGDEVTNDLVPTLAQAWADAMIPIRRDITILDTQAAASVERQRWWHRQVSFASPATAFFEAVSRLTGTAMPTARRWEDAIGGHQRFLNEHLFDAPPRLTLFVPPRQGGRTIQTVEVWPVPRAAMFERFSAPTETLITRARDARSPIVVLAAWAVLLTAVAFVAFARMRY